MAARGVENEIKGKPAETLAPSQCRDLLMVAIGSDLVQIFAVTEGMPEQVVGEDLTMNTHSLDSCISFFKHTFLTCLLLCAPTVPALAIDLEAMAYDVIDLLPLKPEQKGFAKFTVKSPSCSEKLIESAFGDKIMVGMTAAFKVYKPGIKPLDIHSVAECKMKMNPVNYAFSQAMGQSKGLISDMPAPYNSAIQAQADQTAGEFQAEANAEMMSQFPFTKHIDCACEAAFHDFSPAIENAFASIKTGNAKVVGEAVYELAIESSSLPIKPIRKIIEGDLDGAASSLIGQYGIDIGCEIGEVMLQIPAEICLATASTIGKGAKFVAGIAEDIYDELAGSAADPNQYYAGHWRPWLSYSASILVGEQYGAMQPGATASGVLPQIWKPCVDYYADHGDVFDEITFSDDDAARDICDPMRDQFAGGPSGGDLGVVVRTARQAARDFYETGFKEAMYKFATPYAGKPQLIAAPAPWLFAACVKGVDPLVNSLPARNEEDHQALSSALCNELMLGPDNTITQDLKAIAASITPVKTETQKKKEAAQAEKAKKEAAAADKQIVLDAVMSADGDCNTLAGEECNAVRNHVWNGCEALLRGQPPLPVAKAKLCVLSFTPAMIEPFNQLDPKLVALRDRCNGLLPDEGNRKACLSKARAAFYACGKPSITGVVGQFKAFADYPPQVSGNKLFETIYNLSGDLASARLWLESHECPAAETYFTSLESKLAKQKALQDAAAKAQKTPAELAGENGLVDGGGISPKVLAPKGGAEEQPQQQAGAGLSPLRDLIRLGCVEMQPGSKQFRCFAQAAHGRCLSYMKRKQVARCVLRPSGEPQQAAPEQAPEAGAQQVQNNGNRLSPQRDLIRLGCTDVRQDGKMFECAMPAYKRCEAYKGRGQVADCFMKQ